MINLEDIFKNIPINTEIILFIMLVLILSLVFKKSKFNKMSKDEKNKKGAKYEKHVSNYYKERGYLIKERGGYKDGGIDLIAYSNNQILLIQCKNWNHNNSYRIGEKDVREFYGGCNFYIDKEDIRDKNIICIYAIPNKGLLNSRAKNIFKEHYKKCKYEIIEIE